jgi:hypothetical protein
MKGRFTIREGEALITYGNYEDIPLEFDNVIEFLPDAPEGPHTEEQHEEIEGYCGKLKELLQRERK